ncbi:DUF2812 domain-containing protein [Lagierella sp.]|uniref:DUF2812 domain-containing protein n=1 Tax=Lagierella sp. TaxID=2849657 RepID=UPI002614BC7C|nr:DUF2812 domain-containing protein [Lagierella sp.]
MRKLKFFLDPVSQVAPWLNRWEEHGYILANVDKYTYIFKEDNTELLYEVQYVGDFKIKELQGYKDFLRKSGKRYFHLPLDQGGLLTGDLGFFRPFSKQAEKLESTFSMKNRELLLIESRRDDPLNPDSNFEHLSDEYVGISKKYLVSLILVVLGAFLVLRSILKDGFRFIAAIALILLFVFLIDYLVLYIFSNKNAAKYRSMSKE